MMICNLSNHTVSMFTFFDWNEVNITVENDILMTSDLESLKIL